MPSLAKGFSVLLLLSCLFLLASCNLEKEKTIEVQKIPTLSEADEKAQLLASGLQQLPDWTSNWKSINPSFDISSFQIGREISYDLLEWPEENYIKEDHPLYRYLTANPDGKGVVDIYSYKITRPEEGGISFSPDSEVIYFKSNGMRERLLFIGPSGGFEEAIWVSPDHLLVAGFFEEEKGINPKIWLITPDEQKYVTFDNPLFVSGYSKTGYLVKKLKNIDFPDGVN